MNQKGPWKDFLVKKSNLAAIIKYRLNIPHVKFLGPEVFWIFSDKGYSTCTIKYAHVICIYPLNQQSHSYLSLKINVPVCEDIYKMLTTMYTVTKNEK